MSDMSRIGPMSMPACILTALFLVLGAGSASAGAFCVTGIAIPPQCYYDDVASCKGAASPPNSYCAVNPQERLFFSGSSRYCAVQSNRVAQCVFSDAVQCYDASFQDPSVCLDREERPDDINPFRYDQRVGN